MTISIDCTKANCFENDTLASGGQASLDFSAVWRWRQWRDWPGWDGTGKCGLNLNISCCGWAERD